MRRLVCDLPSQETAIFCARLAAFLWVHPQRDVSLEALWGVQERELAWAWVESWQTLGHSPPWHNGNRSGGSPGGSLGGIIEKGRGGCLTEDDILGS